MGPAKRTVTVGSGHGKMPQSPLAGTTTTGHFA